MIIKMRLLCVEVPLDQTKETVEVELPNDAVVDQALAAYLKINDVGIDLEKMQQASLFVNREPAKTGTTLSDGDELLVVRTLAGG